MTFSTSFITMAMTMVLSPPTIVVPTPTTNQGRYLLLTNRWSQHRGFRSGACQRLYGSLHHHRKHSSSSSDLPAWFLVRLNMGQGSSGSSLGLGFGFDSRLGFNMKVRDGDGVKRLLTPQRSRNVRERTKYYCVRGENLKFLPIR